GLFYEEGLEVAIRRAVEERAFRRPSVAPRAFRLLVVGLQAARQVVVDDAPNARDVDPHPERRGRHDDLSASGGEVILRSAPDVWFLATVIAGDAELGRQLFRRGHRADVDQRLLARRREQAAQLISLGSRAAAPDDRELQGRPVESADRDERIVESKAARDIGSNLWGRGRRESGDGRPATGCDRHGEEPIVGAEIVAPGGDAVRLVDHDAADAQLGELVNEAWTGEPLWRQEQQPILAGEGAP